VELTAMTRGVMAVFIFFRLALEQPGLDKPVIMPDIASQLFEGLT